MLELARVPSIAGTAWTSRPARLAALRTPQTQRPVSTEPLESAEAPRGPRLALVVRQVVHELSAGGRASVGTASFVTYVLSRLTLEERIAALQGAPSLSSLRADVRQWLEHCGVGSGWLRAGSATLATVLVEQLARSVGAELAERPVRQALAQALEASARWQRCLARDEALRREAAVLLSGPESVATRVAREIGLDEHAAADLRSLGLPAAQAHLQLRASASAAALERLAARLRGGDASLDPFLLAPALSRTALLSDRVGLSRHAFPFADVEPRDAAQEALLRAVTAHKRTGEDAVLVGLGALVLTAAGGAGPAGAVVAMTATELPALTVRLAEAALLRTVAAANLGDARASTRRALEGIALFVLGTAVASLTRLPAAHRVITSRPTTAFAVELASGAAGHVGAHELAARIAPGEDPKWVAWRAAAGAAVLAPHRASLTRAFTDLARSLRYDPVEGASERAIEAFAAAYGCALASAATAEELVGEFVAFGRLVLARRRAQASSLR